MRGLAALAGLSLVAACTSAPPAAVANVPTYPADKPLMTSLDVAWADHVMSQLAATTSPAQMRALLEDGLTKRELQHRGLDAVTVDEWIDGVVAASLASQRLPDDPQARARLVDATDRYIAARREAGTGRGVYPTNCLPWGR